jgi:hypothetical protein
MDDKFKCRCMKVDDSYIEQMAGVLEMSATMSAPQACGKLVAFAAARVAGSVGVQISGLTIDEVREEVMRQFDIGVAYAQQMMAQAGDQRIDH